MAVIWNPPGVLRGDRSGEACFTTLLVGRTLPATWPRHIARLQRDAAVLGLEPPDFEKLATQISKLASQSVQRVRIELVALGGSPLLGPPEATGLRVQSEVVPPDQPDALPLTLHTLVRGELGSGLLAGCKLPHRPEYWLLRRQAQAAGFGDALLTTPDGLWSEAATANILIGLKDDKFVTPGPRAAPLPGTTLAALSAHLPVERIDLDSNTLICWMVLLNAVWGARPVTAVDGRALAEPPPGVLTLARQLTWPAS